MKNMDCLNIEYLIYKLELVINSFERINQQDYVKRLNLAKTKLDIAFKMVKKGKSIQDKEIQEVISSASNSINSLINKITLDCDENVNIDFKM